jgi:anti-sigma B factor antagonist
MQINIQQRDGATVAEVLIPRLDASMASSFKNELLEIIKNGVTKLVLDLSAVAFIDSSGLGALVSILKAMNGKGSISIAGANSTVMGLFKLTSMDRVFSIHATVDAALAN